MTRTDLLCESCKIYLSVLYFCIDAVAEAVRDLTLMTPPSTEWSPSPDTAAYDRRQPSPEPNWEYLSQFQVSKDTRPKSQRRRANRQGRHQTMARFIEALDAHIRAGRLKPSRGSTGDVYLEYFDEAAAARADEPFRCYRIPVERPTPDVCPMAFQDYVRKH